MKSVAPTFILILGFTILLMTGGSLIVTQAQLSAARDFHTSCVTRLQASEYNPSVLDTCVKEAEDLGWELEESVVENDETLFKDRNIHRITLKYQLNLPFFGEAIHKEGSITSYGK